jgi:hypothetical protein
MVIAFEVIIMKPRFEYHLSTKDEESYIEEEGVKYIPLCKAPKGNTAYTRFFGDEKLDKFVVKQPKPAKWRGDLDQLKRDDLIADYKARYENEFELWNRIHPNNKATLNIDGGLRLILPHLGTRLSWWLAKFPFRIIKTDEQLEFCQITLAVLLEVKRLHDLGLYHGDFNADNIVLNKNEEGSFRAYIVDVDCVFNINFLRGRPTEWGVLESLLNDCNVEKYYENFSNDAIPYEQGSSNYKLQLNIVSLEAKVADLNLELNQEHGKLTL